MEKKGLNKIFQNGLPSNFMIIMYFIALCMVIGMISPNFLSRSNILNNLRASSYYGIMGIGMTVVFIAGGLDLSVGSVVGLSGLVAGIGMMNHIPVPISILMGMCTGLIFGIINGVAIVKLGIPPMIVTLGMQFVGRGFVNIITEGKPLYPFPDSFNNIAKIEPLGINIGVIIWLLATILLEFVLTKTTYGRSVYAIGGNMETARLSGLNIDRIQIINYMICGFCASFAGILFTSRITSAQVSTGTGYEMDVIAAVVIGGTSLFGGVGTAFGTFFGSLFMAFLKAGIISMRISAYWQNVLIGGLLILTVGLDQYRRRKQAKA